MQEKATGVRQGLRGFIACGLRVHPCSVEIVDYVTESHALGLLEN